MTSAPHVATAHLQNRLKQSVLALSLRGGLHVGPEAISAASFHDVSITEAQIRAVAHLATAGLTPVPKVVRTGKSLSSSLLERARVVSKGNKILLCVCDLEDIGASPSGLHRVSYAQDIVTNQTLQAPEGTRESRRATTGRLKRHQMSRQGTPHPSAGPCWARGAATAYEEFSDKFLCVQVLTQLRCTQ